MSEHYTVTDDFSDMFLVPIKNGNGNNSFPPVIRDREFVPPPRAIARRDEYLDRPLPNSTESERVILGAVLLDNGLMETIVKMLLTDDFYSPLHRRVFSAMAKLHERGQRIEPILIGEELKREGQLDAIGGVATITNLSFGLPHFSKVDDYIKVIKDKSAVRQLIKLCNAITSEALAEEDGVDIVLDGAESKILALVTERATLSGRTEREGFYSLKEIAPDMQKDFEAYNQGITTGVSTGMKEVDIMLDGGGLQDGGLYLVAGPEKSGKTSLALDWGFNVSAVQDFVSLIITLEMKRKILAKRVYSAFTGIPFYMFRPGFKDSPEFKAYSMALNNLDAFGQIPMQIADGLNTVPKMRRHLRRKVEEGHRKNKPVRYAVVDYMQLAELDENNDKMSPTERVGKVSRALKLLAMELGIPLVVMSSLNRLGMGPTQDKDGDAQAPVPSTQNLRENQSIAFDAEAVFFVHNPAIIPGKIYIPQPITDIQLILDRQRNGPTGVIPLKFVGEFMQFMTLSQYEKYTQRGTQKVMSHGQHLAAQKELDDLWDNSKGFQSGA